MTLHELKVENPYWGLMLDGSKKFEIRYDGDRCFQKGDEVKFRHWDHGYVPNSMPVYAVITVVCHYHQMEGYCVFGFERILK